MDIYHSVCGRYHRHNLPGAHVIRYKNAHVNMDQNIIVSPQRGHSLSLRKPYQHALLGAYRLYKDTAGYGLVVHLPDDASSVWLCSS